MQASIEHPSGSKIVIRQIENCMTVDGERKTFGESWLVTIPAERTHGKGRVRKQCATLEKAKDWAEEQDKALGRGSGYLELSESDRGQAMAAFQLAKDAKLPLIDLVKDAIAATKLVGSSERLVDAGRYWKERKGNIKPKTVVDAITELLKAKEQDGVSAVHYKDLRLRLENGFSEKFGLANVGDLDAQQIDAWLRGLDVGKRSRVNYRRVVLTFLRFCERRGWLARGAIDGSMIDSPKVKANGPVEVFKPEELRLLLEESSDKLRPYFILGGLCGLRTAESLRIDWSEIDFKRNTVTVEADKAKTASRRIVPLCDSAKEWLLPLKQTSGRVLPYYHVAKEVNRFLVRLNREQQEKAAKKNTKFKEFVWRQNALRHTYISARMAIVKDAAKVALECGNSPAMIFSNYRELIHDDTAAEWFAIMPAKPAENVVQMPKANAG